MHLPPHLPPPLSHFSVQYHESTAVTAPPKIQTRLVMSYDGVARANVLNDAWWFMLFRLGFAGANFNTPDKFYDDLLPLLVGHPTPTASAHPFRPSSSPLPFREALWSKAMGCRADSELLYFGIHEQYLFASTIVTNRIACVCVRAESLRWRTRQQA